MGMSSHLARSLGSRIDINALVGNMVDRRRDGLYDRVRLPAGVPTPGEIVCFQEGILFQKADGSFKSWNDTNLYGDGQLNAPFDAIVRRFLMIFQPGGSRADEHTFLRNYTWEFWQLQKCMQRHLLLELSVRGNIADVIKNFGSEDCRGKLERLAVPYAYDLGDLVRYIPSLVSFKVALVGESFIPEQAMDLYTILDGTMDFPVQ